MNKQNIFFSNIKTVITIIGFFTIISWQISAVHASEKDYVVNRDAWLTVMQSEISKTCDDFRNSPFCFARTQDICKQYLPIAINQCITRYKEEMSQRLSKKDINNWSKKIGQCTVEEFIILAGGENVDLEKKNCN
ncbi:MAG: hypothetical protein CSA20_05265 [Deltaproteobacteria bacterium]|nr:MAG: hypothetical protein CSA20_05265 [Deltaproteobacteria bacterium]